MDLNKFGLKLKLSISFGLQLCFLLMIGSVGFYSLKKVTSTYKHIVEENFPKEKLLSEFRMIQKDLVIAVKTSLSANGDSAILEEQSKAVQDALSRFEKSAKKFDSLPLALKEQESWNKIKENWTPLISFSEKIIDLSKSTDDKSIVERDRYLRANFETLRKNVRTPVEELRGYQIEDSEYWSNSAEETAKAATLGLTLSALVGLLLGLFTAFYFTRSLHSLLTRITKKLSDEAQEMALASKQISSSSDELSSSTSRQATALQQTSSAIEEISSMIGKTVDSSENSKKISVESQDTILDGQRLIQQMVSAIEEINASNTHIAQEIDQNNLEIHSIVNLIGEIENKTQIINDIVFQTKLLSFNASVEAARAGEHGKGFAVVAEEVGNLAQMSGNAAKEISIMLQGSVQKVESIVKKSTARMKDLVESGKEKVTLGLETAKLCDHTFQKIVTKTAQVKDLMVEISMATQEQFKGVDEVSRAIRELDTATKQNSVVSKQSSNSSNQLQKQADTLSAVVIQLSNAVEGRDPNQQEAA